MLYSLSKMLRQPATRLRRTFATGAAALLAAVTSSTAAYDIYWTNDKLIYGSAADGSNPTIVFDGTSLMAGRAIDVAVTASHIYWTENADPANPELSQIWRAGRDGSNADVLIDPSPMFAAPQFLEIDEANNKIYFTCWAEGLFSANLDDGENLALVAKPGSNHTGIALRAPNEMALVTAASNDSNTVYVVNLSTGSSSQGFSASGSHQTYGLAADPATGLLYQADYASNERHILEMNLTSLTERTLHTAANRPLGVDLSPSGKYLVFVDGNNLTALNLETGKATPLVTGLAAFGVALAADPAPREDILFQDDFESFTAGEHLPQTHWNHIREGGDRGTLIVTTDENEIFRQGSSNQYVALNMASGQGVVNLGSINQFAPGEGPELITFSMEFIEPHESPFNDSSRLGMRLLSGEGTGTTLSQLDVRQLRQAGLIEQNKHYRVDYLVNTTDQDVAYSRADGTGSWTLPANSAAGWVYDPAVGPGDNPGLENLDLAPTKGPFTGFLLATFSTNSIVINIDHVRVYDEIVVGRDLPEITVPGTGFSAWQAEHFSPEELADESISGPGASPAGDGISNLMKYALGLNPHTPARDQLPQSGIVNGELALVYERPIGIDDVEYVVEVSSDLITWESGASFTTTNIVADTETGLETVTVQAIGYPGENPKGFLRLRIVAD